MAHLKDLIVNGVSRLIGDIYGNSIQIKTIKIPSDSNSTTYTAGSDGQVLKTNGTSAYWGSNSADSINIASTTNSVAYFTNNTGSFGSDADFKWDATNNILTAPKLNGYVVAGEASGTTVGVKATAEGDSVQATGTASHAEGYGTKATNAYSHAEGYSTTAAGIYSHAEGYTSRATVTASHAEGYSTTASGTYSHAEGTSTIASGQNGSHAEGNGSKASGGSSHAEGYQTTANGAYGSHSEGWQSIANASASHAEGRTSYAAKEYSHAEGFSTTASGQEAHSEGYQTVASGTASHAEGWQTIASATAAHAEGYSTTASGEKSHAEGYGTTASGYNSHAEGQGTIANHQSQHTFGEFNTADDSAGGVDSRGTYIEIVGNGTSNTTRSNARTLDWNGNEWLAGSITATTFNGALNGTASYAIADGSGNTIASTYLPLAGGTMTGSIHLVGNQSSAFNDKGLIFTKGSRIGENTSGGLGIYGDSIYLRPGSTATASTDGIQIDNAGVIPTNNNTETLGDSSHKWSSVYATTFVGSLNGTAANALQTIGTLTIGNINYNGSSSAVVSIADLGLSSAITFLGVTSTDVGTSANQNTATVAIIGGSNVTATNGNVVIVQSTGQEYVYNTSQNPKWQPLGLATSYALQNHIHGNISNGGSISTTATIGAGYHLTISDTTGKIYSSSITFTSGTSKYLREDGSWQTVSTADEKVKQTATTSTSAEYPVILGYSTATTEVTNYVNKASTFTYNPGTNTLTVNGGTVVADNFTGTLNGAVGTAASLSTSGGTGMFWRGDNTWSNTLTGAIHTKGYGLSDQNNNVQLTSSIYQQGNDVKFVYNDSSNQYVGTALQYNTTNGNTTFQHPVTMNDTLTTNGLIGTVDIDYGDTLPVTATEGQIFFQTSSASTTTLEALNIFYPVGSIYMSVNNTNPGLLFGGTWIAIQGRFLLGADSIYTGGSTGGKSSYIADDMPAHTHNRGTMEITGSLQHNNTYSGTPYSDSLLSGAFIPKNISGTQYYLNERSSGSGWCDVDFKASNSWTGETSQSGIDATATIMPPYLAVYIWQRTA